MKYRLRVKNIISGYKKIINESSFYSKDMYGWTSTPIEYTEKDQCLELKDKKGNVLFHGDICLNIKTNEIVIIYIKNKIWFKVNNLNFEYEKLDVSLSYTKILKRFDFLYEYTQKEDILSKVIL